MMRSFFMYLSKAAWARNIVTNWKIAWKAASRFVAGETLEEALAVVKSLNAKGINATLDLLGEHTSTPEEARRATQDIVHILDAIEAADVRSSVSVKLTQIGARIDRDLCLENLHTIVAYAASKNNFIRIDMEDTPYTTETIEMYEQMVAEFPESTGIVIQSYLYRSEKDVQEIVAHGGRIRLCKGAYQEPANLAFPKKADTDKNYDRLAAMMLDAAKAHGAPQISEDGRIAPPPAFATHDPKRIAFVKQYAQELGLDKKALEFQMLNGIRRDLQEQSAAEGYPVRVYVPFGTEWYPYFTRRLAERPANVWFILSNALRR